MLYAKHLNWRTAPLAALKALELLMHGQTNFVRGMMLYNKTFNLDKMLGDHAQPIHYEIPLPPPRCRHCAGHAKAAGLYIHAPRGRAGRHIDDHTEQFVDQTRMGVGELMRHSRDSRRSTMSWIAI